MEAVNIFPQRRSGSFLFPPPAFLFCHRYILRDESEWYVCAGLHAGNRANAASPHRPRLPFSHHRHIFTLARERRSVHWLSRNRLGGQLDVERDHKATQNTQDWDKGILFQYEMFKTVQSLHFLVFKVQKLQKNQNKSNLNTNRTQDSQYFIWYHDFWLLEII